MASSEITSTDKSLKVNWPVKFIFAIFGFLKTAENKTLNTATDTQMWARAKILLHLWAFNYIRVL